MRWTVVATIIAAGVTLSVTAAATGISKASDWLGHAVVTRDGEELGTVRDIAIDERTGKVTYLVVSVGSFLIENNLIAIAPDALAPSRTESGALRLEADPATLRSARRFAQDSAWPAEADVVRDAESSRSAAAPGDPEAAPQPPRPQGTATIESRSRTAHLSANERYVKDNAPPEPPASQAPPATRAPPSATQPPAPAVEKAQAKVSRAADTPFDRLDRDGDGVLNRSEFAHELSRRDRYSHIDINANGVIDRDEFDAFRAATSSKAESTPH